MHKGHITNLFIEDDVNNGVVHCRGFWKTGRYARQSQVKWCPTIIDDPQSKRGIRQPAHQEAQYHDHDHPGHLPLCLLGGRRLSLGLCCLWRKIASDKSWKSARQHIGKFYSQLQPETLVRKWVTLCKINKAFKVTLLWRLKNKCIQKHTAYAKTPKTKHLMKGCYQIKHTHKSPVRVHHLRIWGPKEAVSSRKRWQKRDMRIQCQKWTSQRTHCYICCQSCTSLVHRSTGNPLGYTWTHREWLSAVQEG